MIHYFEFFSNILINWYIKIENDDVLPRFVCDLQQLKTNGPQTWATFFRIVLIRQYLSSSMVRKNAENLSTKQCTIFNNSNYDFVATFFWALTVFEFNIFDRIQYLPLSCWKSEK